MPTLHVSNMSWKCGYLSGDLLPLLFSMAVSPVKSPMLWGRLTDRGSPPSPGYWISPYRGADEMEEGTEEMPLSASSREMAS